MKLYQLRGLVVIGWDKSTALMSYKPPVWILCPISSLLRIRHLQPLCVHPVHGSILILIPKLAVLHPGQSIFSLYTLATKSIRLQPRILSIRTYSLIMPHNKMENRKILKPNSVLTIYTHWYITLPTLPTDQDKTDMSFSWRRSSNLMGNWALISRVIMGLSSPVSAQQCTGTTVSSLIDVRASEIR